MHYGYRYFLNNVFLLCGIFLQLSSVITPTHRPGSGPSCIDQRCQLPGACYGVRGPLELLLHSLSSQGNATQDMYKLYNF